MVKRLSTIACRQVGFLPFDLACSQVNRNDRLTVTKVMRRCSNSMTNWDHGVSVFEGLEIQMHSGESGCFWVHLQELMW